MRTIIFAPAAGPWGVSFAANLTGIGSWTELQFREALREGKYKGLDNTRSLLPPMPWPNFGQLNDTDLKAVFTFLQSTESVKNIVPPPQQPGRMQ